MEPLRAQEGSKGMSICRVAVLAGSDQAGRHRKVGMAACEGRRDAVADRSTEDNACHEPREANPAAYAEEGTGQPAPSRDGATQAHVGRPWAEETVQQLSL